MSTFGKNIKKIRNVRGLTQVQIAEMLNVNRGMISSYEEGRAEPKIETILKTAEVFQVSLDLLLTGSITVNQLSGFVLPDISQKVDYQPKIESKVAQMFSFLPSLTVFLHSSELGSNSYFKKNDIVFLVPSSPQIGKLMLIKKEETKCLGKLVFLDEECVVLENDQKVFLPCIAYEIIGVYSPFQNIDPIEERFLKLEMRVRIMEKKLGGK